MSVTRVRSGLLRKAARKWRAKYLLFNTRLLTWNSTPTVTFDTVIVVFVIGLGFVLY